MGIFLFFAAIAHRHEFVSPKTKKESGLISSKRGSIFINIDENTNDGDEIVYKYIIDNGSFTEEVLVTKIFGEPITILEDNSNFPFNTWNFSTWGSTDEDFFSPETSITDSPYSNYNNESLEFLVLQESIDLNGFSSAQINFFAK